MKLKIYLIALIAVFAGSKSVNAQTVDSAASERFGEYEIYLIGDFNDWQLPSENIDNGALKASCTVYTELTIGEVYNFAKFFSEGKHKLAVYNLTTNSFIRIHSANGYPEIYNHYEKDAYFNISESNESLSVDDYDLETAKEFSAFEIEVTRSYGMWFDINVGFVGLATFGIAGDGEEFSVKCNIEDPSNVELTEGTNSNSAYYDLNGNKVDFPHSGIIISVSKDSSKKLMIK